MTTLYAATGDDVVRIEPRPGGGRVMETLLGGVGAQCLAIDPHDPFRLYVGTFDQGVFRTRDSGRTWQRVGEDLPHQRILSVAISPSHRTDGLSAVLVGSEPSAIFRTEDDGATWQAMPALGELPSAPTWSFPPRPWTSHVRWIAPSWHDPDLIFAGIELGGIMRTTDGGATWEDRKPGSYHDAHAVMTHPTAPDRVYEAAGGGVAMSTDRGATWREVDEGMDRHYVWGLAVDPQDPDLWYVSATHGARHAHGDRESAEAFIYRKRGDAPWEALEAGLETPLRSMPYALLIPTARPSELYAGMRDGSLFLSEDQGDSWHQLDVLLPSIQALVAAPE